MEFTAHTGNKVENFTVTLNGHDFEVESHRGLEVTGTVNDDGEIDEGCASKLWDAGSFEEALQDALFTLKA